MNETITDEEILYCSFCGKQQSEVLKLVAGRTAFICNECIDLCHEIIHDEEFTSPDVHHDSSSA